MARRRYAGEIVRRVEALEDADSAVAAGSGGSAARVVRTLAKDAYPTAPDSYFYCKVFDVGGEEKEGEPGVLTEREGVFLYAWNRGTEIPPEDTLLLAVTAGGRWTIEWNIPPP